MSNPFDLSGRHAVVKACPTASARPSQLHLLVQVRMWRDCTARTWTAPTAPPSTSKALGRRALFVKGDSGDDATIEALADLAEAEIGPLDIWVNNAAALMVKPFLETTTKDWHALLAANLHGYFYGCLAAGRRMAPRRSGRSYGAPDRHFQ